jgi:hypothetical protein
LECHQRWGCVNADDKHTLRNGAISITGFAANVS